MRKCPVDDFTLKTETYEGVTIDSCPHCGGIWLDAGELEAVQNAQDSDFRTVTTSALDQVRAAEDMGKAAQEGPRHCVECQTELVKKEYAYTSQVMIDQCPNGHGLWLDQGEMSRLEMFFETQEDMSKILADMETEGQGFGALLSRLWKRSKG